MQVTNNMAVSIHYTLTNDEGVTLDSSLNEAPMLYLHGAGQIISGLENALTGKHIGDKFTVTIEPADAYGEKNDEMYQQVPLSMFDDIDGTLEEGMQFHVDASHGVSVVTVSKIDGDQVTIDGNHPLAGIPLTFEVEVKEIRAATEDEIKHQHIHSEGCHH